MISPHKKKKPRAPFEKNPKGSRTHVPGCHAQNSDAEGEVGRHAPAGYILDFFRYSDAEGEVGRHAHAGYILDFFRYIH